MNTENTSQEGATDKKIEKESDDELESDIDLYADHEIKEEMVIGPVVLQEEVNATDCCEDVPVAKKIKLEVKDVKTDQVELKKEIIEDNNEETISNVDIKSERTVKNEEQSKTLPKYNQTPGIACNDCDQKFRKICELAQHIVSHEKIKQDNNFKCKECTYQTGSQDTLEQHYKLHDIDRIFASDRPLDRPKTLQHFDYSKIEEYSCCSCRYTYNSKSSFERHLYIHTLKKPYSCPVCKYRSDYKSIMLRHLSTHNEEKSYSCSECEYKGTNKTNLIRHLRKYPHMKKTH